MSKFAHLYFLYSISDFKIVLVFLEVIFKSKSVVPGNGFHKCQSKACRASLAAGVEAVEESCLVQGLAAVVGDGKFSM